MITSYRQDLARVEFCTAVPLPLGVASLANHVGVIVRDGAGKEVLGLDAPRMIAAMADEHFLRKWSIDGLPGKAMSTLHLAVPPQLPVSAAAQNTDPTQAAASFTDRIEGKPLRQA